MKEVEIPGGLAYFNTKPTGRSKKKIRAAGISAAMALSDYPELFEGPREGESDEDRAARLELVKLRLTPEQAEFRDNMREAVVLAMLNYWTLDIPVPRNTESLEDLDGDLYDALLDAADELETAETDFSPVPIKANGEGKESPTTGSSDLQPQSEDPVENLSTPILGSDGSPTDGDSSSPEQ